MSTIVTDVAQSTKRAKSYWRALKMRALRRFDVDFDIFTFPKKSVVWSKLVYHISEPVTLDQLGDWLEDERALLDDLDVKCPAQLQVELGLPSHSRFEYAHSKDISEESRGNLHDAIALIRDVWPEAYDEMRELLLAVAWISSGSCMLSTSDPKKFGLAHVNSQYYSQAGFYELATALIHESAHHALFVESALDPLISRDFHKMIFSPLRREMRPAIGVMHSLFATGRILQWARRLLGHVPKPASFREVNRILSIYKNSLSVADGLRDQCGLTEQGIKIISEISDFQRSFPGSAYG